eukprot:9956692-Prorocentrum_lima.AAC.1
MNAANVLSKEGKKNRNSWCKLYDADSAGHCSRVAQINFFSKIDNPVEPLLDGLPFACVTTRKHNWVERKGLKQGEYDGRERKVFYENLLSVTCKDDESLDYKQAFVATYNILSTRMAVAARSTNSTVDEEQEEDTATNNNEDSAASSSSKGSILLFSLDRPREVLHFNETIRKQMHPYHRQDRLESMVREVKESLKKQVQ